MTRKKAGSLHQVELSLKPDKNGHIQCTHVIHLSKYNLQISSGKQHHENNTMQTANKNNRNCSKNRRVLCFKLKYVLISYYQTYFASSVFI